MRPRWRILLAIAGLMLICLSCAAVVYAVWPASSVRERMVLLSELFGLP